MNDVLIRHFTKYPLMQPQDAVKLLYQSEFGGGHMIADPQQSFRRLKEEHNRIQKDFSLPLTENIGGGMVRINLHAVDPQKFPLEQINDIFVRSAAQKTGTMQNFTRKMDLLTRLAAARQILLPCGELLSYLEKYRQEGCPAVSHSAIYKKAYDPAYRVVCQNLL